MIPLSQKQPKLGDHHRKTLDFVKASFAVRGFAPSIRETCQGVGLRSSSTVHAHLRTLEKLGHLRRDGTANQPRAYCLAEPVITLEHELLAEWVAEWTAQNGTMTDLYQRTVAFLAAQK